MSPVHTPSDSAQLHLHHQGQLYCFTGEVQSLLSGLLFHSHSQKASFPIFHRWQGVGMRPIVPILLSSMTYEGGGGGSSPTFIPTGMAYLLCRQKDQFYFPSQVKGRRPFLESVVLSTLSLTQPAHAHTICE